MVVLSAAVCTKSGKALLSRQFVEMSRLRVEGLLSAFPKLIASELQAASSGSAGAGGGAGKQHTFVETDNVRYVYLPLEASLYLMLITNKGSNIIEDLDTLRMCSRVVPEQLGLGIPLTEDNVSAKAFEIIFAFDEVIAHGGYREEVTLHQVRVNLEMESHEEKLAEMIKASKMAEAKEAAKRKAGELRERAREDEKARARDGGGSGPTRYGGFGSGGGGGGSGGGGDEYSGGGGRGSGGAQGLASGGGSYGGSGYGGGGGRGNDRDDSASTSAGSKATASAKGSSATGGGSTSGMKLGAKKAGGLVGAASGALAGVMAEEGIKDRDHHEDSGVGGAQGAVAAARAAVEAASSDQASVAIEEHFSLRLTRDGGVSSAEVKGTMTLTVHDEGAARLKVLTSRGMEDKAFAYQNHPNVNKALFAAEGVVGLKAADRPFPTASPVGVLRWRYTAKDEDTSQVPLMLTCWPEEGSQGMMNVNLEYTLTRDDLHLSDVVITVPLGSEDTPRVGSCDGVWKHNMRENCLQWRLESVSSDNASGTLEFSIKGKSVDAFFPVNIVYASTDTLCPLTIDAIVPADAAASHGDKPLRFSVSKAFTAECAIE